jgi:hypothetical protein
MNRRRWLAALAAVPFLAAVDAMAQMRTFPPNGKIGTLTDPQWPVVSIDGERTRMAPGCIIWDQNGRTITGNFLPQQAAVWFVKNLQGELARIYLLTDREREVIEEAERRRR